MSSILWVTSLASVMMFFFFFVLPSLDRVRVRDHQPVAAAAPSRKRSAKTAH